MDKEKTIKYTYDQVGMLTSIKKEDSKVEITYDKRGNRISICKDSVNVKKG